ASLLPSAVFGQDAEVSVAAGERIARIGGCHDCHTAGYNEAGGQIDTARALMGNPVGFNGPWGTTFAANLRRIAADHSEDEWVAYLSELKARPPMPWFNLPYFREAEMRSLHQYIVSLGEVGDPAPPYVPPGQTPTMPYVVMAPPVMPR
ncbi:MAG: Cytochrome c mono- and diheme variant, partial [Devosia sp.]|nr:Cytochrome c mono- and diheme variant [Devosia sp.]